MVLTILMGVVALVFFLMWLGGRRRPQRTCWECADLQLKIDDNEANTATLVADLERAKSAACDWEKRYDGLVAELQTVRAESAQALAEEVAARLRVQTAGGRMVALASDMVAAAEAMK
jgi:hypothetical protein